MAEGSKRLLITGSRDWDDMVTLEQELTTAWINLGEGDDVTLVSGNCPTGADKAAEDYWRRSKFGPIEKHPADWEKLGKKAGYVRNAEMAKLGADLCVAFIKDGSKGTQMMINLAEKAGIPVVKAVLTS
jgi:hypothetical protein